MLKLHTRGKPRRKPTAEEGSPSRRRREEGADRNPDRPSLPRRRACRVPVRQEMKCGIVGLPNVGKSTLFNALTKAGIAAENYPFCTIEPNVGIVAVPDPRLDGIAEIAKPQKVIPAIVEFVDIAGLVAGASKGEGLGNQFLANIRETDAIAHVVRCFEDPNVIHVAGHGRSDVRHRDDRHRARARRPRSRSRSSSRSTRRSRKTGGDKEAQRLVAVLEKVQRGARRGQAGALASSLSKEELRGAEAAVPAHHQADALRRQRRRGRLPGQPAARRGRGARGEAKAPGRADLRRDRSGDRRHARRGQEAVPRRHGPGGAGPGPRDPRRLRAARPADLLHRRAEGSARLDGAGRRAPRRRPPA